MCPLLGGFFLFDLLCHGLYSICFHCWFIIENSKTTVCELLISIVFSISVLLLLDIC